MGVHTALESWQIIPIPKTIGWKTVPLICRANKETRWPRDSPALRNLDTERVERIDTASGARSYKCWKHRCMEAIGTSAKVIFCRTNSRKQHSVAETKRWDLVASDHKWQQNFMVGLIDINFASLWPPKIEMFVTTTVSFYTPIDIFSQASITIAQATFATLLSV